MRVIEKSMLNAVVNGSSFCGSNTCVSTENGVSSVRLFGNLIAQYNHSTKQLWISNCGWETNTTRSRLSVLLEHFKGMYVTQKKWEWFIGFYGGKNRLEPFSNYNRTWI